MVFTVYCLYCNVSGLVVFLLNKFDLIWFKRGRTVVCDRWTRVLPRHLSSTQVWTLNNGRRSSKIPRVKTRSSSLPVRNLERNTAAVFKSTQFWNFDPLWRRYLTFGGPVTLRSSRGPCRFDYLLQILLNYCFMVQLAGVMWDLIARR